MSDFSTDRLSPTARGTPVATHNEQENSNIPQKSRKPAKPAPSRDNNDHLERSEERVRQIDQMA